MALELGIVSAFSRNLENKLSSLLFSCEKSTDLGKTYFI